MTEGEYQQRVTAEQELQWHRTEAEREAKIARDALERASYHTRQIDTWNEYLQNLGRVTLQIVPPMQRQPMEDRQQI